MKKLGLIVVLMAVAVMFAVPAFAACSSCGKATCATCPKPCVTCGKPCNALQATADQITSTKPCWQKCTFVNPVCKVAETICPGPGKDKNKLKPFLSCNPCPSKPCSKCGK